MWLAVMQKLVRNGLDVRAGGARDHTSRTTPASALLRTKEYEVTYRRFVTASDSQL